MITLPVLIVIIRVNALVRLLLLSVVIMLLLLNHLLQSNRLGLSLGIIT